MYNLDKKQKIILGIIILVILVFIFYYVYARDEGENSNLINNLEIKTTETQEEKSEEIDEEYSDKFILVHVSGAVNKEGIVELKIDSRIADAIEKARRS